MSASRLDELDPEDKKHYEIAVTIADESMQANEVPVGCILVFEGKVIGRGHNEVNKRRNSTYHAEMIAIDQVCLFGLDLLFLLFVLYSNSSLLGLRMVPKDRTQI